MWTKLNSSQKNFLVIGLFTLAVFSLYVPWESPAILPDLDRLLGDDKKLVNIELFWASTEYEWAWKRPRKARVDLRTLACTWCAISFTTAGVVVWARS